MTCLSSIFSSRTLRASWLPGPAACLALAILVAAEIAVRCLTPDLGWYEGLSSLNQWVGRLNHEINAEKPDVWLLGNSVLAYGVDIPALSEQSGHSCIALPFGGATIGGDAAMLEYFLRRSPAPPSHVVVCATKDDFNANGDRARISKKYLEYDSWRGITFDRLVRLADSRNTIMNTIKRRIFGDRGLSEKTPDEPSFGGVIPPEKIEYMRYLMKDYRLDFSGLDALARAADGNGFNVSLVFAPVSSAYLEFHDRTHPEIPLDEVRMAVRRECGKRGIRFLDLSGLAPDDVSLYSDPYHLTPAGRALFTPRLAALVDSPSS